MRYTALVYLDIFQPNCGVIIMRQLLTVLFILLCSKISFAAENISIKTNSTNFFENIISDTLLLLDPDLKKIIADDLDSVVAHSKFQLPVNSWKPRPNPKNSLLTIYDRITSNNLPDSLASLIQPIVELACIPQKYDPTNDISSQCIKEMFKYPILEPIVLKYSYISGKTKEQYITSLTGLNSNNRYQQMVLTTADIMNGAFEKVRQKKIAASVIVTKYPLPLVHAGSSISSGSGGTGGSSNRSKADLERELLKDKLNDKDYRDRNSQDSLNKRLKDLEKDEDQYFYNQQRKDATRPVIINHY